MEGRFLLPIRDLAHDSRRFYTESAAVGQEKQVMIQVDEYWDISAADEFVFLLAPIRSAYKSSKLYA